MINKKRKNKTIQKEKQTLNEKIVIKGINYSSKATIFNDINIGTVKDILNNQNFTQTMKLYRTMLKRDWQISGDLKERQVEIIGAKYKIDGKDKRILNFIENYFLNIKLTSLLADINSGIEYGYSLIDLIWDSKSIDGVTYFLPTKFNFIQQILVQLDDKKGLFVQDNKLNKYYLDDYSYKFLLHTHKMSSGDILDYSILSTLIWIFTIKHFIVGQSMNYCELLGVPPIIVNSNSNDKDTILEMMEQVLELRSGSAGVFGKDDKVSLVEGKASSDMFLNFIKYCDNAITHIILGGSISSSSNTSGSFARDNVHNSIKDSYHEADMKLVSDTINELIKKICDLNFNNIKEYPKFSLIYESSTQYNQAQSEQKPKNNNIDKNYKFVEFNKKLANSELDIQLNKLDTKNTEDDILKNIENIMQKADSYQEAILIISQEYENLNLDSLESLIENYMFNATISGSLNA
ncbi:phage portal protein family protein [Aliarcobacter vitoriensis]|uniref:Mu-like prophage protein gp29 n=1 Tax=Aliarcobacter vitoriensis TaxID=2011099 RepID=A0A366MRD7_9BACT|nr:DUF935 family protein [Aliarcobacter vitoriensis]RBQ28403.1 hypothetical protein CRU91_09285 [Aliarcobacter vitoriensis]